MCMEALNVDDVEEMMKDLNSRGGDGGRRGKRCVDCYIYNIYESGG